MKFILFLSIIMMSAPAFAEEKFVLSATDKKIVMDTANKFAQCSGFFLAMGWLSRNAGREEGAIDFENRARGWSLAGAYMMYSVDAIKDWQKAIAYEESVSQSAAQSFKALIEGEKPENFAKVTEKFLKETCIPMVEYQESLVSQIREKMATVKE